MKDSLLLPVIFLLIFLVVFLLIAGLATLKSWGECFSEGSNTLVEAISYNLSVRLLQILPVSILISLVALFIRILVKPGSRFLSFLFPLGTAFAVLIFGYYFLNETSSPPHAEKRAVKAERFLLPGKFTDLGGYTVYAEALQNGKAANLILMEDRKSATENEQKKFNFYSRIEIDADEQGITLYPLNEKGVKINARPVYSSIFQEESQLSSFFRDIGLLNAELDKVLEQLLGTHQRAAGLFAFDAASAEACDILDELRTASLLTARKVVLIKDADHFISKNRQLLERYFENPSSTAVLVLTVQSWPANTKLAK